MGHMYTSTHTYTRTYTHTGRTGFGTATKKKTRRREGTRPVRAARGGGWAPLTSSSANERVAKPADASAGTSFSTRVKQVFCFVFCFVFFWHSRRCSRPFPLLQRADRVRPRRRNGPRRIGNSQHGRDDAAERVPFPPRNGPVPETVSRQLRQRKKGSVLFVSKCNISIPWRT